MGGGAGNSVLVVDDDESLRMLCRVNLELEGYRVLEAPTIEAAQAIIHSELIDVVLLDVHVGAGDGFTLVDEIRASRPQAGIALFTGSAEVNAERRAAVDEVIPKPFSIDELSAAVERLAA
jgi:two-component system, NtrC family, nitrogen regulation response regulator NtrX